MAQVACARAGSSHFKIEEKMPMSHALTLLQPSTELCASYRELVAEFLASGEQLVPFVLEFDNSNDAAFLRKLANCAGGIDLPEGFVAHSSYWLVSAERGVVGVSNIRHALTDALRREGGHIGYGIRPSHRRLGLGNTLLRLSLRKAADLGLQRLLITCAKTNAASARVILNNGGAFESEEYLPARNTIVQRYWVDTAFDA